MFVYSHSSSTLVGGYHHPLTDWSLMRWPYLSEVLQVASEKTKAQTHVSGAKTSAVHHRQSALTPGAFLGSVTVQPVKPWLVKYKEIGKQRGHIKSKCIYYFKNLEYSAL